MATDNGTVIHARGRNRHATLRNDGCMCTCMSACHTRWCEYLCVQTHAANEMETYSDIDVHAQNDFLRVKAPLPSCPRARDGARVDATHASARAWQRRARAEQTAAYTLSILGDVGVRSLHSRRVECVCAAASATANKSAPDMARLGR